MRRFSWYSQRFTKALECLCCYGISRVNTAGLDGTNVENEQMMLSYPEVLREFAVPKPVRSQLLQVRATYIK